MVHYKRNALVIVIKSACAGVDHERLMTGINTALRMALACPEKRRNDMDELVPLFDLQACLLPDERELCEGKQVQAE